MGGASLMRNNPFVGADPEITVTVDEEIPDVGARRPYSRQDVFEEENLRDPRGRRLLYRPVAKRAV